MPLKTTPDEPPTINMIPMIDMMFNLIIFFLVGTEFATLERNITLRVPEVVDKGALTTAPERRVVNVFRDGTVTLDEKQVTLDHLTKRLAAARAQYSDLASWCGAMGKACFSAWRRCSTPASRRVFRNLESRCG